MPRKIRQLVAELRGCGFLCKLGMGKGSHRVFVEPMTKVRITISGHDGDDAHSYQERQVRIKIAEVQQRRNDDK